MRWTKIGRVFAPDGSHSWMKSHAQVPTVLVLPDRLRVYFAARPRHDLSLTTYVDLDRSDPQKLISIHQEPVIDVGAPGTFDCDGVMPSAVVRDEDRVLLYYSGWCRLAGLAPYNNATGVAVSRDDGATYQRCFQGPILDRTATEPWSATSPAVTRVGSRWLMWYSSGTGWVEIDGKLEHEYVLKEAWSEDGLQWTRPNRPLFERRSDGESQTRPTVLHRAGRWHMWFCFRGSRGFRETGQTYRIGYAWSNDLSKWHRDDGAAGIDVSPEGWDAQMIAYPAVVEVGSRVYMFYNGNDFGRTGFGCAVLGD